MKRSGRCSGHLLVALIAVGLTLAGCSKSDPKKEALCGDMKIVQTVIEGFDSPGAGPDVDFDRLQQNLDEDSYAYLQAGEVQISRDVEAVRDALSSGSLLGVISIPDTDALKTSLAQLQPEVSC